MQKNTINNVVFGILVAVLLFTLYDNSAVKVELKKYRQEIEVIQKERDSLHEVNKRLKTTIEVYKQQLSVLDAKVDSLNTNIYEIKKKAKADIAAVSNYTNVQSQRFFTNRYN